MSLELLAHLRDLGQEVELLRTDLSALKRRLAVLGAAKPPRPDQAGAWDYLRAYV